METLIGLSGDGASIETPSRDGKFLLQLLKGGNNRQKDEDKHNMQEQEEELASWQLHDPAVAAMGPSHPFPVIVGDISADMQPRPPYMSHASTLGTPYPFHLENTPLPHTFRPENTFSSMEPRFHPPGGSSLPSVFRENVDLSVQSNLAYAFQSRGDRPLFPVLGEVSYSQTVEGCMPSHRQRFLPSVSQSFDLQSHPLADPFPSLSHSVVMNEQKTLNFGRQPSHHQKTMVDQANFEIKESDKVNGREVDALQAQHRRLSHQEFYGNGADLLRLLHGNADKTSGSCSDGGTSVRLLGDIQNPPGTYSNGSALTVHGPIGPLRNQDSVTKCPSDILGRLWAVTPYSQNSQDFHPEAGLRPSFEDHKNNSLEISSNGAIWNGNGVIQEKKVKISSSSINGGNALSSQLDADERLGTAATLTCFTSRSMPESIQPHGVGNLLHSWNGVNGPSQTLESREAFNMRQHNQTSSESHGLFNRDQDSNNLKPNCSHGLSTSTMALLECAHREQKLDLSCQNQIEARKGGGRQTQLGGGSKKGGSKEIAGHRVATSERQNGRGLEADTYVHGLQAEEELEFQTPKPIKLVFSKADEAKRRKWQLKQPQLGDSLQQKLVEWAEDASVTSLEGEVFDNSEDEKHLALVPLASQVEHPGLPAGCLQDSVSGPALQEGRQRWEGVMAAFKQDEMESSCLDIEDCEMHEDMLAKEELFEKFAGYLELEDDQGVQDHNQHNNRITSQQTVKNPEVSKCRNISQEPYRPKQQTLMAHAKSGLRRHADLENFTMLLLAIFRSLIPSEEEETRRRKVLSQLDAVVYDKWPGAKLFLFGSCANAFGVRNSDIDVCLNVEDKQLNKAELVVRMAEILEAANMQNVQALTHARVPIVKFTDPVTDISCDICVNNMLAVVNSKLLHDYAKIDVRLRQLAFIVKHWAKRRQVNETYRGTLSSYAYVLMCIHFLQQRNPPILPCLQGMEHTYCVKVGKIECAYYDQVETLSQFGFQNKDSLGELVTSFFEYWAFHHDYNHVVISVRTGGFLSKDEKAWTRRIGNERHLICIEDPFEVTHDLGRVVDKHSIRVLRDEFYRAAKIMRHNSNPSVTLFEPYIRDTF